MGTFDVFNSDAFSLRTLTAAIEKVPHKPGRLGELGLFSSQGIPTTIVQVEEVDGQLSLIASSPYGAPVPDPLGASKRKLRAFSVPHLARESTVVAAEVQGVRAFGTESETDVVQTVINQRLTILRAMHEVTLEHLRIGAVKGQILDADGTTVLFNLFTEFDVAQQTQDFNFTTATLNVRNVCVAALRKVEDELGGSTYTGARALCSSGFFDALIAHAKVEESFKVSEGLVLRQDLRKGFLFGGIMWEEYRGAVAKPGGGTVSFIPANEAVLIPEGVMTVQGPLFQTYFAPADFAETVNTMGLPLYAKIATDPEFNRWAKVHSQANPLPICLRPRAVIRLTKS